MSGDGSEEIKPAPPSKAWLVIFADLTALLLAFFVLLFSMSEIQLQSWEAIVESLSQELNPRDVPNVPRLGSQGSLPKISIPKAFDLDYLHAVVGEKIAGDPILARSILQRLEGELVISLPSDVLFSPGSGELTIEAERAITLIGDVLQYVGNDVAIYGHTDPAPIDNAAFASNWELSLARAMAVAEVLKSHGMTRNLATFGLADSRFYQLEPKLEEDRRYELARRVDVVIREGAERQHFDVP